jgi:esterase/lipase superfamily enzyme
MNSRVDGSRMARRVSPRRLIGCLGLGCVFFLASCTRALMPTPTVYANNRDADPFAEVRPELQSNRIEVVYATDRGVSRRAPDTLLYSTERMPRLSFGACDIEIGRDMAWAELHAESRRRNREHPLRLAVSKTHELGQLPPIPHVLYARNAAELEAMEAAKRDGIDRLQAIVDERLANCRRKEAFVYVHGYNSRFDTAALTIAELWHFLGREGVPILYSWPAGVGTLGYLAEREYGEASIGHLKTFLLALRGCEELERIHIIAHSRGCDIVTRALQELHIRFRAQGRETRGELRLGHLVLAAPDLDMYVARQRFLAEDVQNVPERLTIYTSPEDRAISISRWFYGGDSRLGGVERDELSDPNLLSFARVSNIDVVVSLAERTSFLAHRYFTDSPAVSSDLVLLLRYDCPPGTEGGRPLQPIESNLWLLPDDYPGEGSALPSSRDAS